MWESSRTPCLGLVRLALAVALAVALTVAPVSSAEVPPTDAESACGEGAGLAAAHRIQARYDEIRDLAGRFTQTNESSTFGGEPLMSPEQKTGGVVFAKPGKMRWTYEAPERSVVVSNGNTLWLYDVEGRTVTQLAVTAGFLSGAALQFLLGDGKILESFEVRAAACSAGRITLDLLPKAESTYERLGLLADAETGEILATSVLDLFGNLTMIEFADVVVNRDPDRALFEFEAPEGVEVIEYDGSPTS